MAEPTKMAHPSLEERAARGKVARKAVSPSSHAGWAPAADRPDPVMLLQEQNARREPDLVPVRHGRMMVSPFTFYRGAARIMAADLKDTPRAGLTAQLCGDAHLSNFGIFASPERQLVFDLNDFDETLPGPFEYDVARLAASFTIAARNNGFGKADERSATRTVARAYREAMAEFAQMRVMDIWYARLTEEDLRAALRSMAPEPAPVTKKAAAPKGKQAKKAKRQQADARRATEKAGELRIQKAADKARTRDSLQALSKLAEYVDGRYRIVSQPPIVVPARDLLADLRYLPRRGPPRHPSGVQGLPRDPAIGPPPSAREASSWSTWRGRSSASAAWEHARSSPCFWAATIRIRSSCRSRRRRTPCWRNTCRRAVTSPARAWCTASG